MESLYRKSAIALVIGIVLSGCASKEPAQEPISGAMNQPQLDEVTLVSPEPVMATPSNPPKVQKQEYKFTGVVHDKGTGEAI